MLKVECTRCPRAGRYSVAKLIATMGRDANMAEWLWRLKQDCPAQFLVLAERATPILYGRADASRGIGNSGHCQAKFKIFHPA